MTWERVTYLFLEVENNNFIAKRKGNKYTNMVNLLEFFLLMHDLKINWDKSIVSWSWQRSKKKLGWTKGFKWKWPKASAFSKLLGVPFGLDLDVKEVMTLCWRKCIRSLGFGIICTFVC